MGTSNVLQTFGTPCTIRISYKRGRLLNSDTGKTFQMQNYGIIAISMRKDFQ